jgi:hypothetical protein
MIICKWRILSEDEECQNIAIYIYKYMENPKLVSRCLKHSRTITNSLSFISTESGWHKIQCGFIFPYTEIVAKE